MFDYWLNLQLFADGAAGATGGDGAANAAGEGAAPGDNSAVDAEQQLNQRLLDLGVPPDKLRKRAKKGAVQLPPGAVSTQPPQQQAANAAQPQQEQKPAAPQTQKPTWDEIMADPEYNKKMQDIVKARLKSNGEAEDTLSKMGPAIELMARRYNLDAENLDYDALVKAINDDNSYYEGKALEMGVDVETAKKIDQNEREVARRQRQDAKTLEQQKLNDHVQKIQAQAAELKKTFPNFDLMEELKNPTFARLTGPNVGLSVEDAYYAVHRKEIQAASMQIAAQQAQQKVVNAIQAGQSRPDESGITGQAPSVTVFDYRKASKDQRAALKQAIRDAAARGEKLYPGQRIP